MTLVRPIADGESAAVERLLYEVLYRDFGVACDGPWRHAGASGDLLVADRGGSIVGTVHLLDPGARERRLRQLAVRPEARGRGVGCALVRKAELVALRAGADAVILNARDTAWAFYERMGYGFTGGVFTSELTGIAHRPMRRDLRTGS